MSFWRYGDSGILITATGVRSVNFAASPPVGGLTITDVAEYVNTAGAFQALTADADTTPTITGVAPLAVWFDASASRSVDPNADDEGGAWTRMNYRLDSGEAIAGTWRLSGLPKNVTEGAPVVGHVFTVPGTHTVRRWVRDTEGRQGTVTFSVVITAPGAGTTINEGGSWPTWADGGIYYLAAGTDHTAKGTINWSGRHGIRLVKSGEGANPVISGLRFDSRTVETSVIERTRNCCTWNINVPQLTDSPIGHMHCAVVGSDTPMVWSPTSLDYFWLTETSDTTARNNMAYNRGFALWGVAELNSNGTEYTFLGGGKNITFRDVDLHKNAGGSNAHVYRGGADGLDLRNCRFRSTTPVASYNKIHGWNNGTTFDAWPPFDRWGLVGTGQYLPVTRKVAIENNVYGAAGDTNPSNNIEACPENNDGSIQAVELVSIQGNVWYESSWSGWSIAMSGRHIHYHNNRLNMGAGAEASYATGAGVGRLATTPPGWNGPYVNAARPALVL